MTEYIENLSWEEEELQKKSRVWSCDKLNHGTTSPDFIILMFHHFPPLFWLKRWTVAEEPVMQLCCVPPFNHLCCCATKARLTQIPLQDSSLVIHISETHRLDGWSCAFLVLPPAFTSDHMSLIELMGFWHRTKGKDGDGEGGAAGSEMSRAGKGRPFSALKRCQVYHASF